MTADPQKNDREMAIEVFGAPETGGPSLLDEIHFRSSPEDDLLFLALYEYSRESAKIRRRVKDLRDRPKDFHFHPTWQRLASCLNGFQPYPHQPWSRLGKADRLKISGLFGDVFKAYQTYTQGKTIESVLVFESDHQKFESLIDSSIPGRFALERFLLDRSAYQEEIMAAFESWIQRLGVQPRHKKRGRSGAPLDQLNHLMALRLRYHCQCLNEAQELLKSLQQKGLNLSGYGDRKTFDRACDGAVTNFRELLELPDDFPLRTTNGWKVR